MFTRSRNHTRRLTHTSALVGGLIVAIGFAAPGLAAAADDDSPPITLPPSFVLPPPTDPVFSLPPITIPPTTDPVISLPTDITIVPTTDPVISLPVDINVPTTTSPTITVPVDITVPSTTTTPPAYDVMSLPSAPQSPQAKAGTQSVTVTWFAPASNGGASITHYQVQRATDLDSGEWTDVGFPSSMSFTNNTGLTVGELYYYRVRAHNVAGYGTWSSAVSAKPYTFPGSPHSLVATPVKSGVKLTWSAPFSDGNSSIIGYHVSVFTPDCADKVDDIYILSNAPTVTRTYSEDNGVAHCFKVQASNYAGYGPYSNHAVAMAGRPSAPAPCSLDYWPSDYPGYFGYMKLSWSEPDWGGEPASSWVPDYHIVYTNGQMYHEIEAWDGDVEDYWDIELGPYQQEPPTGTWWAEISAVNSEGEGLACTTNSVTVVD
jgi:hypothetical protein